MKKNPNCLRYLFELILSILFVVAIVVLVAFFLRTPELLPDDPCRIPLLMLIWFLYGVFVCIEKLLITWGVTHHKGEKLFRGCDCKRVVKSLVFLPVSPDYAFTALSKTDQGKLTDDDIKDKQINFYNLANVILSGILAVILFFSRSFAHVECLVAILFFRFASRSIEILVSFFFDIVRPSKRRTRLTKGRRVGLALLSLVEVAFLVFGFFLTQGVSGLRAVHHALVSLMGTSPEATPLTLEMFFRLFGNLMATFILGFVVVTYLSSSSFYEGAPVLIASNGKTTLEKKFERVRAGVYRINVLDVLGQNLKVFYEGEYYGYSAFSSDEKGVLKANNDLDDFVLTSQENPWLYLKDGKDAFPLSLNDLDAR